MVPENADIRTNVSISMRALIEPEQGMIWKERSDLEAKKRMYGVFSQGMTCGPGAFEKCRLKDSSRPTSHAHHGK